MLLTAKLTLLSTILIVSSVTANAESIYEQKQLVCAAIMHKIDTELKSRTGRDIIRDNGHVSQATLWAISYQQHGCSPEPYLNSLRRNLK